jgi:hypothetical protein
LIRTKESKEIQDNPNLPGGLNAPGAGIFQGKPNPSAKVAPVTLNRLNVASNRTRKEGALAAI